MTWDNAVLMGPAAADGLVVESGDMVTVSLGERQVTAAVYVVPGQHRVEEEGSYSSSGYNRYGLENAHAFTVLPSPSNDFGILLRD